MWERIFSNKINYFAFKSSCSSDADEGDFSIDPSGSGTGPVKAVREKERRQANNVRERYVNWAIFKFIFFFKKRLV